MITVLGAAGHTGEAAVERLLAAGKKIRVVGRSADKLKAFTNRGAEASVGDVLDAAFLTRAFQGAEAIYAMVPPDFSQPDPQGFYNRVGNSIAQAVQRAGVKRIVLLSSLGAELPDGTGPIKGLHDVEELFRSLGVNLLILRPGSFYDNFAASLGLIKQQGINGGAIAPDLPIAMTATRDIGAAAADELVRGEFRGTSVRELIGPRDYTMSEATRILGERIGKPELKYIQFPDADFANALVQMGFSPGAADSFIEMCHAANAGKLRSLQGRTPRSTMPTPFETFADQLAAAYRAM